MGASVTKARLRKSRRETCHRCVADGRAVDAPWGLDQQTPPHTKTHLEQGHVDARVLLDPVVREPVQVVRQAVEDREADGHGLVDQVRARLSRSMPRTGFGGSAVKRVVGCLVRVCFFACLCLRAYNATEQRRVP